MKYDGRDFNDKKELREYLKKKRSSMTFNRIMMHSGIISKTLFGLDVYKESDVVLAYVSYSSEVGTHFLIKHALEHGKKVAVPKVLSKTEMEFYYIDSLEELEPGAFNILEPKTVKAVEYEEGKKYIMLLPGIAFDSNKNRLGYGGGYYDRYLSKHKDIYKIMLAYELEKMDEPLPCDELDVPSDIIITELKVYN
jgi:5-formyltetrahydrofolate cyclo-ligase